MYKIKSSLVSTCMVLLMGTLSALTMPTLLDALKFDTSLGKGPFPVKMGALVRIQDINLLKNHPAEANGIDWRAEGLSFHSFRHFFNTRLVADGVNGELICIFQLKKQQKMGYFRPACKDSLQ